MSESDFDQRLSKIATHWSQVFAAHRDRSTEKLGMLLLRYRAAVYRYFLGVVRNPDVAEDLTSDLAVQFLSGNFHRANPNFGRFRDYLKRALINMLNGYYRDQKRTPLSIDSGLQEPASAPQQVQHEGINGYLREEMLNTTWAALRQQSPNYYAVLQLRVTYPEMAASEMARELKTSFEKPVSAAGVRKTLERARRKFADLLVEQVAETIDNCGRCALEVELKELNLQRYCQAAVGRWNK